MKVHYSSFFCSLGFSQELKGTSLYEFECMPTLMYLKIKLCITKYFLSLRASKMANVLRLNTYPIVYRESGPSTCVVYSIAPSNLFLLFDFSVSFRICMNIDGAKYFMTSHYLETFIKIFSWYLVFTSSSKYFSRDIVGNSPSNILRKCLCMKMRVMRVLDLELAIVPEKKIQS